MTRRLLLSLSPGEIWVALVQDGELQVLRLVRTHGAARAGDLYAGRVVALRPDVPAALIDIDDARPAFLGGEDMPRNVKLREGEAVVVRVTKAARADKAAAVTMKLDAAEQKFAAGDRVPKLLRRRETALVSLVNEFADADELVVDDAAAVAEAKATYGGKVTRYADVTPLFEAEGIASAVESALLPRAPLPKDGAIAIEPTSAAILIDVDGGRGGALSANLAAAKEIARQIRLRDLSGPFVIDFIGMKDRGARDRVAAALKQAMGEGAQYLGWTRLGHFELVVKRRRPSLTEQLFERGSDAAATRTALTVALDALRRLRRESAAAPGKRFRLQVHPDIAACLDRDAAEARRELEARLGYAVKIAAEMRPRDSVAIVPISSSP